MTIFSMPAITFFAILSWPIFFIAAAVVVYIIMAKQDALVDDSEFEKGMTVKGGGEQ